MSRYIEQEVAAVHGVTRCCEVWLQNRSRGWFLNWLLVAFSTLFMCSRITKDWQCISTVKTCILLHFALPRFSIRKNHIIISPIYDSIIMAGIQIRAFDRSTAHSGSTHALADMPPLFTRSIFERSQKLTKFLQSLYSKAFRTS